MHSWEVTCVELGEESKHDDCRAIEKIGFKVARQIRKRNVDQACSMIGSDLTRYHVVVNGEEKITLNLGYEPKPSIDTEILIEWIWNELKPKLEVLVKLVLWENEVSRVEFKGN